MKNEPFASSIIKNQSLIYDIDGYTALVNSDYSLVLSCFPDQSINLIATDPPYGVSQNPWDTAPDLKQMWEQFNRVITPKGIIVLTATQPFASQVIMSNAGNFKYDLIWQKTIGSGQLNIKKQPLRVHESILVFYNKAGGTYNEQLTEGKPYKIDRKVSFKGEGYGKQSNSSTINDGFRHAKSVLTVSNPRIKGGHTTQKPEALMEWIIKTYSNKDDVVLDPFMGSGTTGVAAKKLDRKFIGIEMNDKYYDVAKKRIGDW